MTTPCRRTCCRFMLRDILLSEMPKYTEQMLQKIQTGIFFNMLMISQIGILPTAGECYSLNTPPSQGARQLIISSYPMIFKLLPFVPQYFEESVSCTNPTTEISHTFTFKYHLLYLFWFNTSQVLSYELFSYKNCDRHLQAPL